MKELVKFQKDRGLDKKPFELRNEIVNIFEELIEAGGLDVPKANRPELKERLDVFIKELFQDGVVQRDKHEATVEDKVDAFADIITFATGAILKLGHNPLIAVEECGKEINSREGSMVDGKFEKDLTPSAKSKWYTADYNKSKM